MAHALMRHLLRGYFDADGYFAVRPTGRTTFGIGACHRTLVAQMQAWCIVQTGVSQTALIPSRSIWHFRQYARREVRQLVSLLYADAAVALPRKLAIAQRLMCADER
jgi:hypothetical protein